MTSLVKESLESLSHLGSSTVYGVTALGVGDIKAELNLGWARGGLL